MVIISGVPIFRIFTVRCMGLHLCFPPCFQRQTTFVTSCLHPWVMRPMKRGIPFHERICSLGGNSPQPHSHPQERSRNET